MSLEAIAVLLGHWPMRMTMVHARIANRTVAEEYFTVSEKVEALYNQPKQLPADAEDSEMARLRREMHRRMLGTGYCARPVGLDCHFESMCESCTFFQTTIEFLPTLERQRDKPSRPGAHRAHSRTDGRHQDGNSDALGHSARRVAVARGALSCIALHLLGVRTWTAAIQVG